jgi:predicted amidohydrolase
VGFGQNDQVDLPARVRDFFRIEGWINAMRVALAQIPVTNDIKANVAAIERGIAFAAESKADILLTPEGSLSGYTHEFDPAAAAQALDTVCRRARECRVGLALGICFVESGDGLCYNQLRFYTPMGQYLGFHSKTLLCGTIGSSPQGECNHYATRPLRTFDWPGGPVIGGLICNDMWANPACTPQPDPWLARQLAIRGARIIFHAVNGGRDGGEWSRGPVWNFHEANLRMRAQAAGVWIVTVDNAHPVELPCSGPGGVIAPNGKWICRTASQGEQFACAEIVID